MFILSGLILAMSVITPIEAQKSVRPFLPQITECLTTVEPKKSLDLTFEVVQSGLVSNLQISGEGLTTNVDCLNKIESKMRLSNQEYALQFVSLRAVYVNSTLQLLPNATVRLPETLLPGIFATPAIKGKLLKLLKNQEQN